MLFCSKKFSHYSPAYVKENSVGNDNYKIIIGERVIDMKSTKMVEVIRITHSNLQPYLYHHHHSDGISLIIWTGFCLLVRFGQLGQLGQRAVRFEVEGETYMMYDDGKRASILHSAPSCPNVEPSANLYAGLTNGEM